MFGKRLRERGSIIVGENRFVLYVTVTAVIGALYIQAARPFTDLYKKSSNLS